MDVPNPTPTLKNKQEEKAQALLLTKNGSLSKKQLFKERGNIETIVNLHFY
jgi:hypothetical protein